MLRWMLLGAAALCLLGTTLSAPVEAQKANKPKETKPKKATKPATRPADKGVLTFSEDPEVVKLDKEVQKLEKELKAKPKDSNLRMKVAEANYRTGHTMMMSPKLMPRVKYRGALKYFRRTLALNPNHKKAQEEKNTIEAIYRQMGRPIPQ